MVTVICQHSNLEFEAETRRTKQHPLIAELKNRANKDGNYREVNDALSEATKQGSYTTIDEYMTLVRQILDGKMQKRTDRINRQATAEKERIAERERWQREQQARNDLLKQHGYKWSVWRVDPEDERDFRTHDTWYLVAPDGNEISEKRAFEAIERGLEVIRAEIAVEEVEAAKKAAEAEAEKERQEAADRAVIAEFNQKVAEIKSTCERIERFEYDYSQREVIINTAKHSSPNKRDQVLRFVIDGVDHYITITGTGYDDDGYYTYYRHSDNPPIIDSDDKSSLDATLNRYFG